MKCGANAGSGLEGRRNLVEKVNAKEIDLTPITLRIGNKCGVRLAIFGNFR